MGRLLRVLKHSPVAVLLAFVVAGAPAPSASAEYPDFTEVCGPYFGPPEPLRPNPLRPRPRPYDEPGERPADPPEPAVIYLEEQPCDPADTSVGRGFFDQAARMFRAAWRWIMPG